MVSSINVKAAEEHLNALRIHEVESGGTMFGIVGSKGCGKTHLLTRLAHQIVFIHPRHKKPMKETVVWRGRSIDYWNFMFDHDFEWESAEFKRDVLVHYWIGDEDSITFKTELGDELPVFDTRVYSGVNDLYANLLQGAINVVYEPSRYVMSPGMEDMITRRSLVSAKTLQEIEMDPCLWWCEFLFYLLHFKKAGFITVILDEIDEIFPGTSQGLRWHMQALFSDSAKDFRKANISLFFSIHDLADLDYRIRSKIQYWGYMKGAVVQQGSLIPSYIPLLLPVGEIILDRGTYGNTNLGPLQARPRVRVSFARDIGDSNLWCNLESLELASEARGANLDEMTCPYCRHTWIPRIDYPAACPKCQKSLYYPDEDSVITS